MTNTRKKHIDWATAYRTHPGKCTWCDRAVAAAIMHAAELRKEGASYTVLCTDEEHAASVVRVA